MSVKLHFASYLRRGMARLIGEAADAAGVPTGDVATVDLELLADNVPVNRSLALVGPGAVTGLVATEVLRVDPQPDSTDHAPNLFPSLELRTPDLPWRYTPAQPNQEKLIPWLVLVVVPDRAGIHVETRVPLPTLHVDDAIELPDLNEAWAWSHVQVAGDTSDLDALLTTSPHAVWARLLCPRELIPDTEYIAGLVPSFEAGRLAGLGLSTADVSDAQLAWTASSSPVELPLYHHWRFRTSPHGADFEELVRRLTPLPLTPDVGVHGLDLSDPGSSLLPQASVEVGFEGALTSPEVEVPHWDPRHRAEFHAGLSELLTQARSTSPSREEPFDPLRHDPVVALPAYGMLQSGRDAMPGSGDKPSPKSPLWLSQCNLDVRHRAVAGLGTEVVRRNQERLMANAWDQAIGIRRVNRTLAQTQLALQVGRCVDKRLAGVSDAAVLQLSAGAHARVASSPGQTVRGALHASDLPSGSVSAALRRQLRPGQTFSKALRDSSAAGDATVAVSTRFTQGVATNPASLLAFTDLTVPYGTVLESGDVADAEGLDVAVVLTPIDYSDWSFDWGHIMPRRLRRSRTRAAGRLRRRFRTTPTVTTSRPVTATVRYPVADAVAVSRSLLEQWSTSFNTHQVDSVYGPIDHVFTGAGTGAAELTGIDLAALSSTLTAAFEPTDLLAARLRHIIEPAEALGDDPVPATLTINPTITDPLYADVVRIDPELLMPGIGALPDESVGLAVVNTTYVEAFLLGANYELGRELLWREYPTDLRSTWLRTFWDHVDAEVDGDIPPIADWNPFALGAHPTEDAAPQQLLVLVIKGDLLRRYPDTLISAMPARWNPDGRREENTAAEPLFPAFQGKLGKSAVFLGFQFPEHLDVDADVRGATQPEAGPPGWYFVFEQPPTEPVFGLDTATSDDSPGLAFWKDLTWADARGSDATGHIQLDALNVTLPYDERGDNTWPETWADSASAMARITLQRPVRMLVHADQMLAA